MMFESSDGLDPNSWKAAGIFQNTSRENAKLFLSKFLWYLGSAKPQGLNLSINKERYPLVTIIREAKGKEKTLEK